MHGIEIDKNKILVTYNHRKKLMAKRQKNGVVADTTSNVLLI